MNVRVVALTTGIFGACAMFFLAWWLIPNWKSRRPGHSI
jgi:hypothetical protein